MECLFTRTPILKSLTYKTVGDFRNNLLNSASLFNIATGFISSDSLVELKRLLEIREGNLNINLFIGMNYLDGFTELQYNTLAGLNEYLIDNKVGNIYLSPKALYHGKMYSFSNDKGKCMGSFIGSSNLGSFIGTTHNNIEADLYFQGDDATLIDSNIRAIITDLGTKFSNVQPPKDFLSPETDLLKGLDFVTKLSDNEYIEAMSKLSGERVEIPLKTEEKSNLNTYFGAGKTPGRYSPRSWYEVELIVSKNTPNIELLPDKDYGPFTVITPNQYSFKCERQGDYSKNLRSSKDLRILGKWIKGEMENKGVLRCGEKITQSTLNAFGKTKIVFRKSLEEGVWFINLE